MKDYQKALHKALHKIYLEEPWKFGGPERVFLCDLSEKYRQRRPLNVSAHRWLQIIGARVIGKMDPLVLAMDRSKPAPSRPLWRGEHVGRKGINQ